MLCGGVQHAPHRASLGIARPDGVGTIRQCNGAVGANVNDDFCLVHKTVHMARRVILRIGNK